MSNDLASEKRYFLIFASLYTTSGGDVKMDYAISLKTYPNRKKQREVIARDFEKNELEKLYGKLNGSIITNIIELYKEDYYEYIK